MVLADNIEDSFICINYPNQSNQLWEKRNKEGIITITQTETKPTGKSRTKPVMVILTLILVSSIISTIYWFSTTLPGASVTTFDVVVESDTTWSGSISGGTCTNSFQSNSSKTWEIRGTMAAAVIQKQTTGGYLTVTITKNGNVVARQSTSEDYGVVAISATS